MRTTFWVSALVISICTTGPAVSAPASLGTPVPDQSAAANATLAQARLETARQNYQEAVAELAASLNLDMRAVQAHREDLNVILPNFSDEEVRLRQRFGDGDRIASWPAIRQLTLAWRARATPDQRLLSAARARSDAILFAAMVGARDLGATNGELLAMWDEAAALDPSSFEAHMGRARAALALGDKARATRAAETALSAARSPADTAEASTARAMAMR